MNGSEEVAGGLVVTRGNRPVLLEFGEEILDQMTCLVEVAVILAWLPVRCPGRNHDRFALVEPWLHQPELGVIGFVGSWRVLEQDIGAKQIVGLSWREMKSHWIAQRIDRGVNLGTQPASAAPDGLLVRIPPFAPALCWWARTMVASIMAYSLSASCARASKTRCHTPRALQRECRVIVPI